MSAMAEGSLCPCPQPCSWDRVDLHDERDLVDATELRTVKSRGYPGLPGNPVSLEGSPEGGDRKFRDVTVEAGGFQELERGGASGRDSPPR